MKELSGGRTSIECTDSKADIAAFFEDLRAHRAAGRAPSTPAPASDDEPGTTPPASQGAN